MAVLPKIRRANLLAAAAAVMALAGCAQSAAPPLPDLTRTTTDSMMTPAQQQKAIQDLAAKKATEETDALNQIKGSR